jgi:hypothetical protein
MSIRAFLLIICKNPFFISTIGFIVFLIISIFFSKIAFFYVGNLLLSFIIGIYLFLGIESLNLNKKQIDNSNLILGFFMLVFMLLVYLVQHPLLSFYFSILMGNCVAIITRNYYYEYSVLKSNNN